MHLMSTSFYLNTQPASASATHLFTNLMAAAEGSWKHSKFFDVSKSTAIYKKIVFRINHTVILYEDKDSMSPCRMITIECEICCEKGALSGAGRGRGGEVVVTQTIFYNLSAGPHLPTPSQIINSSSAQIRGHS